MEQMRTATDNGVEQPSGRLSVPYVMLYYMPSTCNSAMRMLYAGAKELMRNTSEVTKIIDIESPEELEAGLAWFKRR